MLQKLIQKHAYLADRRKEFLEVSWSDSGRQLHAEDSASVFLFWRHLRLRMSETDQDNEIHYPVYQFTNQQVTSFLKCKPVNNVKN